METQTTSKNKLTKNGYYFIYKGKQHPEYCFFFPTMGRIDKKVINWKTITTSYFFAFLRKYFQINFCTHIQDDNLKLNKEDTVKLMQAVKNAGIVFTNAQEAIEFFKENNHLMILIKNCSTEHPYLKKILISTHKKIYE